MPLRFLRTLSLAVPLLLSVSLASGALAQSIALPAVLNRTASNRDGNHKPYWVSYADCVNDDHLLFNLTFSGTFQGNQMQVWAGSTACVDQPSRTGSSPTCWLVYQGGITVSPTTISIAARDIAGKHLNIESTKGPGSGTRADCDKGVDNPVQLNLYFMFESNDTLIGTASTWTSTWLDITRPEPATNVKAAPGETRIHMSWDISTSTDVIEYWFFCDPPRAGSVAAPLTSWSTDASTGQVRQLLEAGAGGVTSWLDGAVVGAGGSGGTGGTTSTQTSCHSSGPLTTDQVADPAFQATYKCGEVTGRSADNGVASGLANGTEYAVAVAAVDQVLNVGKLSVNQCATPVNVTDFFELYRLYGGKGGGGLCSFGPRQQGPMIPLAVGALVLGARLLRRRRQ